MDVKDTGLPASWPLRSTTSRFSFPRGRRLAHTGCSPRPGPVGTPQVGGLQTRAVPRGACLRLPLLFSLLAGMPRVRPGPERNLYLLEPLRRQAAETVTALLHLVTQAWPPCSRFPATPHTEPRPPHPPGEIQEVWVSSQGCGSLCVALSPSPGLPELSSSGSWVAKN